MQRHFGLRTAVGARIVTDMALAHALTMVLVISAGALTAPTKVATSAPTRVAAAPGVASGARGTAKPEPAASFFDLRAPSIDGANTPLSKWRGKVVLVVNTASQCGNTPQYAGLQQLWERYRSRGLVVLGFPANDFGQQEPGSEAEIKKFCSVNYRVTFPMFAKVVTRGAGQSPVYRFLTAKHGEPEWNFHKYLVGKDGQVVRAFAPTVQPDDAELRAAIEAALVR